MPDYAYLVALMGYVLGTALFIALFFVSIGNYMLERKPTRIIECIMCVALGSISFIRFGGTFRPPFIGPPTVVFGTAVLWLLFCILAIIWSVILATQRWRSISARNMVDQLVREVKRSSEENKPEEVK